MEEKEKILKENDVKRNFELNLPEFYKQLNKAISAKNIQSIYELSKIYTRSCVKKLDH